jgi:hypothetical protein
MPILDEDARGPASEEPEVTLAMAGISIDVARGREAAGTHEAAGAHEARAAPHKGSASVPSSPHGPGGGDAVGVEHVRVEMGHAFLTSTLDGGYTW